MTTTEPAPAAAPSEPAAPKKEHSILDAMKRGRELATAMVLVLTFIHSMYASYFKKEEVAEAGYKQTSDTIEDYSRVVHDEIETLKLRINTLEADVAAAKTVAETVVKIKKPVALVRPPLPVPVALSPVVDAGSPMKRIDVDTDSISDAMDIEDLAPPAPPPDFDPLIVNMPDRPWEQMQKKK